MKCCEYLLRLAKMIMYEQKILPEQKRTSLFCQSLQTIAQKVLRHWVVSCGGKNFPLGRLTRPDIFLAPF